jgi:DivIVA domain-containing protein
MYNDRITLSGSEILEKEFKIDARGYRLQEVDKFLDIIIKDYNEYNSIIKDLAVTNNELAEENERLKIEVRNLKSDLDALKYAEKEVTNVDLLRRVSQLEKIILGKENN